MSEKGGVVIKIKHTADSYIEDKNDGKLQTKKQIELEQNAAKAIINLRHRRECNGEVTKFSWCSDPLCRMWYDMSQYFGFLGDDIIDTDIDNAIISVADGGTGIYERLIVLGHRILDAVGKEYAVKKYTSMGIESIPKEINKFIGEGNKKLLIFLKMRWLSNNICSVLCLSKFAKVYCHYCKAELNSEANKWDDIKLSKYVKFCISFCLYGQSIIDWSNPLNVENKLCQRFPWLEVLVRSMDISILSPSMQENGRFLSSDAIRNSRILGILWKYFGYNKNKKSIPPRILFALNTPEGSQLPEEKTGQMIFNHYISHYFKAVASEHGFTGVDVLHWVEKEKNNMLKSNAVEFFALIDLELGEIYSSGINLKPEEKFLRYRGLFFSLLANMFVLSEEDKNAQVWIQELVTCVRQLQLYILEYQNFTSNISSKINIVPQNEIMAITETTLDHTHTPEIFLSSESEEIQSFISLLENYRYPEIDEVIKDLFAVSKSCFDKIIESACVPQKWLKENLNKYVLCDRYGVQGKIRNFNKLDLIKNTNEINKPNKNEFEFEKDVIYSEDELDFTKKNQNVKKTHRIHCAEILTPILKPVTLRLAENTPGVEIKPVSMTFVDQDGKPVHYTLKPNSSSIPKGFVKPVKEISIKNDNLIDLKPLNGHLSENELPEEQLNDNEEKQRRSRSLHVFSRNTGRSRSPNYRIFERREHGIFGCEKTQDTILNENINVYKDKRNYFNYFGHSPDYLQYLNN